MKPKIFLFAALSAAALCSCGAADSAQKQSFIFDTYSSVSVRGNGAEDILNAVSERLGEISADFSLCYGTNASELPPKGVYSDCSAKTAELNRLYGDKINIACGALTELWGISTPNPRIPSDSEIENALKTIRHFDSGSVPEGMRFDFGAVSKGYACDEAFLLLSVSEADYAVVSLSSSTLLYGKKPNGEKFRTGITNPKTGNGYLGVIETSSAFISTSGGYERFFETDGKRYCHILDISSGRPVETDLTSVTVIVPADTPNGGIMSDFLATEIFSEGAESLDKWLVCENFELIAADENGTVFSSCKGFALNEDSGYEYGKR